MTTIIKSSTPETIRGTETYTVTAIADAGNITANLTFTVLGSGTHVTDSTVIAFGAIGGQGRYGFAAIDATSGVPQ